MSLSESIRSQKRRLRREMVARILALDPHERHRQEAALSDRLATLPGFAHAQTVMLYVTAFPEELGTAAVLRQALGLGKRLVCPRVDRAARRLRLVQIEQMGADFTPGVLGIPEPRSGLPELEPEAIDWVLVPGLAYDERGFRLGRGGGYYDRLLPTLRADTARWALALEPQLVTALPTEPHDQQIDGVATPNRTVFSDRKKPGSF